MIGVLAVLTILAAVLTPVVIREMDQAAWTRENANLVAISNALTLQIVKSNSIPDQTGWPQAVANWVQWPTANVTANARSYSRFYLIDPALSLPSAGGTALPYTQTGDLGLTGAPASARVMIVSTTACGNAPVASGVPSAASFNDIWNTPYYAKPSTWTTFPGTGYDICIQRLNFTPMFYRLILVNRDQLSAGSTMSPQPYTNAPFNINGAARAIVTNGIPWNNYYFAGSAVGLWSTNGYGTNALATTYILNRDISFVFENGAWNGQILDALTATNAPVPTTPTGGGGLGGTYNADAISFFNSEWNAADASQGGKGATQTAVLSAFGNFMLDYTMWADTNPSFNSNGDNNSLLPMAVILGNEQNAVDTYTGTGSGANSGLLHQ